MTTEDSNDPRSDMAADHDIRVKLDEMESLIKEAERHKAQLELVNNKLAEALNAAQYRLVDASLIAAKWMGVAVGLSGLDAEWRSYADHDAQTLGRLIEGYEFSEQSYKQQGGG